MNQNTDPIERDYEAVRERVKSRFGVYLPNRLSVSERLAYCALALALVVHATLGLYIDDLVIPSRRRRPDVHVHGWEALLIACAIYLVAVSLISRIIDHHDKRDNEHLYRQFEQLAWYASGAFVALSFILRMLGW